MGLDADEEAEGKVEGEGTTSLFPLASNFPNSGDRSTSGDSTPQWLCNTSFSFDVSRIHDSVGAVVYEPGPGSDEEKPAEVRERPCYDILELPSSSPSDFEHRESRRRKKRKKHRSHEGVKDTTRKSTVQAWADSGGKQEKDYYFDVRGDRDNLAFGCLYRMDIARFRHHELFNWSNHIVPSKSVRWDLSLMSEGDANGMNSKAKAEGRYYSIRYTALERHKQLKHIHFLCRQRSYAYPEEFIPLTDVSTSDTSSIGTKLGPEIEESWEDQVIRKTKEFNKMTRDFPHDEKAWIAFADYQNKIANMQSTKGARIQALEKKISILEKAAELNPDNEELLLYLMKAYGSRDGGSVLVERWERILMQHPGSCKLWKEFLCSCQSEFSRFRTSDIRKMYAHAIRALSATSMKLCRQAHQIGKVPTSVTELVQVEQGLVDIFVNLCRFEWQTGHQELATALFQAEIDYSLFCPSLLLSELSKLRLFEHFWNGNGARLGEDGAVGWGEWVEKEEKNRQKAAMLEEESIRESEQGGWTGWSEPKMKKSETSESPNEVLEDAPGDTVQEPDSDNVPQDEEDLSALLEKLGIDIKTEADTDVTDVAIWKKWSEEEALRDADQWMPLRGNAERNGEEQLSRVIAFEDVGEYLFSLVSDDARLSLIFQFIDFFDGPITHWTSTNSPTWMEKIRSFEQLPISTLKELWDVDDLMDQNKGNCGNLHLECLFNGAKDASKRASVMKFLQNAILLLLKVFPRNHILEEVALKSDVLFETRATSLVNVITPCRGLAKSLLKNDRQDLLLCGVYARCEAAFGCTDIARKVFDMALSSIDGLPFDLQVNATFLYLWYAEMELGNLTYVSVGSSSPCLERAIHILTCLGTGAKYSPFKCEVPSTQLLRARQGFKDKIRSLRSSWGHGDVSDHSVALVSSAALFEELTAGWPSARGVFEDAFSMVLPERRSRSHHLESLFVSYVAMLLRNLKQATLSRSWETVLQGLHLYPYNPTIFAAFLKVGSLYTVPNKIRRILDDCYQKEPSTVIWLATFLTELRKAGSEHRIHGLFEKALGSDALQKSVMLWRCYLVYELHMCKPAAAKRVFFRAIHACPWSKKLWLDGFQRLSAFLTANELADLQEVMRDKELNLRTDIYEILLQD